MSKEAHRRKKLIRLIKDIALTKTTQNNRIPKTISDYILGEYGLKRIPDEKDIPNEEESDFVDELENFIKEKYKTHKMKDADKLNEVDQKYCLMKSCDSLAAAISAYLQITVSMNSLLHKIVQMKEKYSDYSKEKSSMKTQDLEIVEKKLQCLKLQVFLKFYSERNVFEAQVQLKEILVERLRNLQLQHNNLVDLTAKYNNLKNNKSYIDLLQKYKQLLKKEMKIDYMIEN